ncbi:Predicted arabinose efflux permease, MFS family [Albimonas donghaensis]|uniref:Predicted arabinose efflux permease, MFS family n=1 Tax=Albimonas donghaensis TaxID=356660 RepID=A0A1H2YNZ3_9RHOB|nr:MFS transporter [Albimonas donghaensis]SDX06701.1 Predicted arabinose efflux permease, MFS family [Albimonas donghaensis]
MTTTSPAAAAVSSAPDRLFTPMLISGAVILALGFGVRAAFGLFQIPIEQSYGWPRAEYSLAIALQNLAWGAAQPAFAAMAEKFGTRRTLLVGLAIYAVGLLGSAWATTPEGHQALNILIGFGIAGSGLGVILGAVGREASDKNRSLSLGIVTSAASAGQLILPPILGMLLTSMAWEDVFLVSAAIVAACALLLPLTTGAPPPALPGAAAPAEGTLREALVRAAKDPSFILIFLGFFSCGYQLGFITAHFPAFITEACAAVDPAGLLASVGISSTAALGGWALAMIGAANIGGTLLAGKLGATFPKRWLLTIVYLLRAAVCAAFIVIPMTPATVLIFSVAMGSLWLATVPLTVGLVGVIHGLRYMGTLYGIVFFSHQVGGFLGVWLGGALHDRFGDYAAVWWIGVAISLFSAACHLPVRERPLAALGAPA